MTKYNTYQKKESSRPYGIHPIWRGIGCILMVLVPIISFAAANVTLQYSIDNGLPIPYQLLGSPKLPDWAYNLPIIQDFAIFFSSLTNLYGILFLMLVYIIILSGILSLGYSILYRVFGPPRYSAIDAPPPNRRPLKKSR